MSAGCMARRRRGRTARRLSAIRGFYRFLAREGVRADDPSLLLDGPRPPASLPKFLSEAEVDALLAAAAARRRPPHAALEMLYSTGLRVSELLGLRQHQLAGGATTLIVRGKGGKERMVLLSAAARQAAAALVAGKPAGLAVPRPRPAAADDPAGLRAAAEAGGARGRARPGAGQPARAAAQFRQPHAGPRRRPAQPAVAARPRRHRDDPDLHPCAGRAAAGTGAVASPPIRKRRAGGKPAPCVISSTSNGRSPSWSSRSTSFARCRSPAGSTSRRRFASSRRNPRSSFGSPTRSSRPGRRRRWPATRTGRTRCAYIEGLITEFTPLAGDRAFADDAAVVGGLGRFRGRSVVVLGHRAGLRHGKPGRP